MSSLLIFEKKPFGRNAKRRNRQTGPIFTSFLLGQNCHLSLYTGIIEENKPPNPISAIPLIQDRVDIFSSPHFPSSFAPVGWAFFLFFAGGNWFLFSQ